MNLIVIGCGRVGAELAYRLFQKGHKVSVVDQDANAFNNLPSDFLGRTIEGEAMSQNALHRAGIETADGVACVTSSDTLNAVVAHLARSVFGIANLVVRNYDPAYRSLHEAFNLQVISSSSWGAQRIEELLYHGEIRTVFSAGNGEVELYEFAIPAQCAQYHLADLITSTELIPVSLTRSGKAYLPNPESVLMEGDIMVISSTFEGIAALRKKLQTLQEN